MLSTITSTYDMAMAAPNKLIKQFAALFLVLLLVCCSCKRRNFKIDSSLSPTIDSIYKANIAFDNSPRSMFLFHIKNTFDYNKFGQTNMDLPYFLRTGSTGSKETYIECGNECYLNKDTISLTAILFRENGIGFIISIFPEGFDSKVKLIATRNVYSKSERKADLQNNIVLNSDKADLILTEQPKFEKGSRLKGKINIQFEPFYQLDSSNKLLQIIPQFDIVFDTEVR